MVRELRRLCAKHRAGSIGVHRREERSCGEREGPTREEMEKVAVRLGEDCSKHVRDQPSREIVAAAKARTRRRSGRCRSRRCQRIPPGLTGSHQKGREGGDNAVESERGGVFRAFPSRRRQIEYRFVMVREPQPHRSSSTGWFGGVQRIGLSGGGLCRFPHKARSCDRIWYRRFYGASM